ncbi:MAG: glycosyltransferase [Nitrospira sp.]
MRPLAFCRFLESYGWAPRVLSVDPTTVYPWHPLDPQLSSRLPHGVHVDFVPYRGLLQQIIGWRGRVKDLSRFGRKRPSRIAGVEPTTVSPSQRSKAGKFREIKDFLLNWGFEFPDPQRAWFGPAVACARRLPQGEAPDAILATGGPWTNFLVGKRIAEYWQVPLILDYRDPWTSNPYFSFGSAFLNERSRRLERSIGNVATRIVANTPELQAQLEKDHAGFAGKTVTITNGFDPDLFRNSQEGILQSTVRKANFEISHFGTVYGKRTPIVLLQALLDLYLAGRVTSEHICVRFVGAWEVTDPKCEELAQALEKVGLLTREGSVPYKECLRQMRAADALLVIQPESPLQVPGKIYEYIATGRPLLLLGGDGATENLVNRHRLGVVCANRAESIGQLFLDVLEGRRVLAGPNPTETGRFSYQNLTGDLARVLDEAYDKCRKVRSMKVDVL